VTVFSVVSGPCQLRQSGSCAQSDDYPGARGSSGESCTLTVHATVPTRVNVIAFQEPDSNQDSNLKIGNKEYSSNRRRRIPVMPQTPFQTDPLNNGDTITWSQQGVEQKAASCFGTRCRYVGWYICLGSVVPPPPMYASDPIDCQVKHPYRSEVASLIPCPHCGQALSVGDHNTCAIDANKHAWCFGNMLGYGELIVPGNGLPGDPYTDVGPRRRRDKRISAPVAGAHRWAVSALE